MKQHTVPISLVKGAVAASERHGIPRAQLLGRPSVTEAEVAAGRRVSWDAFCEFNARLEAAWAGRGGLERFARESTPEFPELRAVARALLSPRQMLELMVSVGRWAHPLLETSTLGLDDGRLEVVIRIPESLRDDPPFLRICAHTLAETPRLVGLPSAEVELSLHPRKALMRFATPPSRTLFARTHDAADRTARMTLERIVQLQDEVRALRGALDGRGAGDVAPRARELGRRWQLTPRQTEVLAALARGLSNRELAASLGCTERTVEQHVTAILKRSGHSSRARLAASFWTDPA